MKGKKKGIFLHVDLQVCTRTNFYVPFFLSVFRSSWLSSSSNRPFELNRRCLGEI
jgi:hypothetical protein